MTRDKEVQRQLLRLHGFNLMSHILKEYPKDVPILQAVRLPFFLSLFLRRC